VARLFLLVALLIILFFPVANAASIGIWPAEINTTVLPFKASSVKVYLFNPGDKDEKINLYAMCDGLSKNTLTFLDIGIYPTDVTLEKNTTAYTPQGIDVFINNHLIIKRVIFFNFFGKRLGIPVFAILFNKNNVQCKINAATNIEKMPLIVSSRINIELVGIDSKRLIIFVIFALIIFILAIGKYYRKLTKEEQTSF
jgi:hypothetical protein